MRKCTVSQTRQSGRKTIHLHGSAVCKCGLPDAGNAFRNIYWLETAATAKCIAADALKTIWKIDRFNFFAEIESIITNVFRISAESNTFQSVAAIESIVRDLGYVTGHINRRDIIAIVEYTDTDMSHACGNSNRCDFIKIWKTVIPDRCDSIADNYSGEFVWVFIPGLTIRSHKNIEHVACAVDRKSSGIRVIAPEGVSACKVINQCQVGISEITIIKRINSVTADVEFCALVCFKARFGSVPWETVDRKEIYIIKRWAALECICANAWDILGDHDRFKWSATGKCIITDIGYAVRNIYIFKRGALIESWFLNARHTIRNNDRFYACLRKNSRTYICYAVGDVYGLKITTSVECVISDSGYTVRNGDRIKVVIIKESVAANVCYTIFDYEFLSIEVIPRLLTWRIIAHRSWTAYRQNAVFDTPVNIIAGLSFSYRISIYCNPAYGHNCRHDEHESEHSAPSFLYHGDTPQVFAWK